MKDVIYIEKKNFCKYQNLNIVAFSLAFGGAMGSPGQILVVTKEGLVYSMNYVYGDMIFHMCCEVCPPLKDCEFGVLDVERTPEGWKGVRLGMGNFLVLTEPIFNLLKDKILEMPPHILYGKWLTMVLETIPKK